MYIAASLEKAGIQTEIIDVKSYYHESMSEEAKQKVVKRILDNVAEIKPVLVGITCLVTEVKEVLDLSNRIKKIVEDTRVAVGGIHPTMYPAEFLYKNSPVDYVVIGEGEQTVPELARAVKGKGDPKDILGIAWLDNGRVCGTAPRSAIENLDELPFPQYSKVDAEYYFRPNIHGIRPMLLSTAFIFTSRGCPYRCTFCVNKNVQAIMGSTKLVRSRGVKNVVNEIECLAKEYLIDGFYIWDDTFCLKENYVLEFCKELSNRNLDLIWAAETRVNLVSEDMIQAMRDAGCVQIDFGVESGSEEVLARIKKGITVGQVKNAFHICHNVGMRTFANFMFNTPGETEDDVNKTLCLAREIRADSYNFALTTPFPGTDLYNEIEPKLTVDEYSLLKEAKGTITDPRFKLAKHRLDLSKLVNDANPSFNTLRKRISFVLNRKYFGRMLRSKRKRGYAFALLDLSSVFIRRHGRI